MNERKRAALVTGSGKNIGRATVLNLARDGFNVVINGSSDRAACDEVAEKAKALPADNLARRSQFGCQVLMRHRQGAVGGSQGKQPLRQTLVQAFEGHFLHHMHDIGNPVGILPENHAPEPG